MKLKCFLSTLLFTLVAQVFASPVLDPTAFYELLKNKDRKGFISFIKDVDKNYQPVYPESENLENRLLMALLVSDMEKIGEFLDKGAGKKLNIWMPSLYFAIDISLPIEILELLIDNGFDVNYQYRDFELSFYPPGTTPLMLLGDNKAEYSINVAKFLLSKNAKINVISSNGSTALSQAVGFGNIELTKLLINGGGYVNYSNSLDETYLTLATYQGNLDMVELLVKYGADINHVSKKGNALWYALFAEKNNEELVRYFIEKEANVNYSDSLGKTPLIVAAYKGNLDMVELLVKHGADLNAQDTQGRTALIHAVYKNKRDVAKLLISAGTDLSIRSNQGMTALEYAKSINSPIVDLLEH